MFSRASLFTLIGALALYQLRQYFVDDVIIAGSSRNQFDDPLAERTLKRTLVIFRHGDRAPNLYTAKIQIGPLGCTNKTSWPDGCGELTKRGKQDAFYLGQRLRHRYDAILTKTFSKSNLKVTSTSMTRTLMSAQLVSAGLFFPPKDHHVWHESLHWHPVPVFPNRACNLNNGFLCPSFATELTNIIPKVERELRSNKELMMTLAEGGINVDNPKISLMFLLALVYDVAFLADRNGLQIEPWQRKILTNHESVYDRVFSQFIDGNDKLQIINSGPQVKWIANELSAEPGRQFTMYSGHDLTILAVMSALGVTPRSTPLPTACLAIELHENRGKRLVKVFYYEAAKGEFKKLKIACEDSSNEGCNYEDFTKLIGKYYPDNYDEICQGDKEKNSLEINENVKMFVKGVRSQFTE